MTVIELVIVIAAIGILGALAVALMVGMNARMRMMDATEKVSTAISLARAGALANPLTHCGVFFDRTVNGVLVFYDTNGDLRYTSGSDTIAKPSDKFLRSIRFYTPAGDTLNDDAVLFRGDGSAWDGGSIGVETTSSSARKTFTVVQATGAVTVQ